MNRLVADENHYTTDVTVEEIRKTVIHLDLSRITIPDDSTEVELEIFGGLGRPRRIKFSPENFWRS